VRTNQQYTVDPDPDPDSDPDPDGNYEQTVNRNNRGLRPKENHFAATLLTRDMDPKAAGARLHRLFDGFTRLLRCVVGFTQVGQNHMAKTVMAERFQKLARIDVGQVARTPLNALFQRPWIGPLDEHGRIVIGFQDQQGAIFKVLFDHARGDAQVRGDADFVAIAADGETCGVTGVMGCGKWMDLGVCRS
jgi:hypothetical protein